MIKIENVDVYGWEAAIRGARNPMNSWDKSDSVYEPDPKHPGCYFLTVGDNDLRLLRSLANAGSDHGKFLRMITVTMDITAPLYWWKEYDTYKVGTVANSCSTMHKIHAKEFTLDDFSHEHLFNGADQSEGEFDEEYWKNPETCLEYTVSVLNHYRQKYLEAKTKPMKEAAKRAWLMKSYWWQMIQLLPSSYNQRRTVQLNYQVLKTMYFARRHHKLDEWCDLCEFIKTLPYSELIIGGDE